jgi:ribosomal protein S18
MNIDNLTRKFIKNEGKVPPKDITAYIQALKETLSKLSPKTQSDYKRIEIAKEHIREVRRGVRRMQQKMQVLEEQVKVLEEEKK